MLDRVEKNAGNPVVPSQSNMEKRSEVFLQPSSISSVQNVETSDSCCLTSFITAVFQVCLNFFKSLFCCKAEEVEEEPPVIKEPEIQPAIQPQKEAESEVEEVRFFFNSLSVESRVAFLEVANRLAFVEYWGLVSPKEETTVHDLSALFDAELKKFTPLE